MSPDTEPPARPRRERPLVAPGRERREPGPAPDPESELLPPTEPTVMTPPVGRPVIEFPDAPVAPERDDHVEMSFDGPTRQNRWTIAFRFFLAIPHYLLLILLLIAAQFGVVIAWIAALFTKQVPRGLAEFLANTLQYLSRVMGYSVLLLSDRYPPFNTGDSDYAINVHANTGEFNRAAVFFRMILVIPGYVVATLVLYGAMCVMTLGWFIALVLGRLPTPLWQANAAALRYFTRAYAFTFLVTAEQPKGLFGDKAPAAARAPFGGDMPDLPETPRISRLLLSKAARVLVGSFIAIGALLYVAQIAISINSLDNSQAYQDLEASQQRLEISITEFESDTQACVTSNGGLPCGRAAAAELADAFDTFAAEVAAIEYPFGYDADLVVEDAGNCAAALRGMATAEEQARYGEAFRDYQAQLQQLIEHYNQLTYEISF